MNHERRGLLPALFLLTLAYFALGFVSILFANLAIFCILIPFLMLGFTKQRTWCHRYCPRASLAEAVGKSRPWRKSPHFIASGQTKRYLLWYFSLNLLFIAGSTTRIALHQMEAMPFIRLFIVIPLFSLPQLLTLGMPAWLLHLSYRFYSMMLSTTILSVAFALLYRPRLWCSVCPMGNLMNTMKHSFR